MQFGGGREHVSTQKNKNFVNFCNFTAIMLKINSEENYLAYTRKIIKIEKMRSNKFKIFRINYQYLFDLFALFMIFPIFPSTRVLFPFFVFTFFFFFLSCIYTWYLKEARVRESAIIKRAVIMVVELRKMCIIIAFSSKLLFSSFFSCTK